MWHPERSTFEGGLLPAATILANLVLVLVVSFLLFEAWPVLRDVGPWQLLTGTQWEPSHHRFGMGPMVVATMVSSGMAVALAFPLGLAVAVASESFFSERFQHGVRSMLGLMAGIPSVVFGLWGLNSLAPLIAKWHQPGVSLLTAALVLALMILPTIALLSENALRGVPTESLQAAAALGLDRTATLRYVQLPAARRGLLTALLLATGRALGETMAVLMVSGNVVRMPSTLTGPVRTLTANMALEVSYAMGHHRAALFASGVALTLVSAGMLLLTRRTIEGASRV